jgi:dUTP pyrophosphatase
MKLKVVRLSSTAKLPTKAYSNDAGFDLYADERILMDKYQIWKTFGTGIAMEIPEGYFGMIKPRSGLSVKQGIDVLAGVVDSSYRGEIKVCLSIPYNSDYLCLEKGDKIAQMVILPVPQIEIEEVLQLSLTDRGEKGFGSSGK